MKTASQVAGLLELLDERIGAELEAQDLDFKEWDAKSLDKAVRTVWEYAICMANGGGGTVVFGVADRVLGRADAIKGIPPEIDAGLLKKAVYDNTDPRIIPTFELLQVPEGTGRLLIMQVHPGMPPHTDTAGKGTIRVEKECRPLTGTLRRKLAVETGDTDYTAEVVEAELASVLSASAMEQLRAAARREGAQEADLASQGDAELLNSLGVIKSGKPTRAAVLLAGSPEAVHRHLPGYVWTHLRMSSDLEYSDRADGQEALPVALNKVLDRIQADNPIQTYREGLFHYEYRTYPELALREALMNAFSHADLRMGSPIMVKQYSNKLELTNPGGLIGGINPLNILHHAPVPRNPCLVGALVKLRLVNRSNFGVGRMFRALLAEGKEPPRIEDMGESVRVTFTASDLAAPFRNFVQEESDAGRGLGVDQLLVIQYLLRHPEIDTATASRICQRSELEAREVLSMLERQYEYLERGGAGRSTFWMLRSELHRKLAAPGTFERDLRLDIEAAKTRILSVLNRRADLHEAGLSNTELRKLTLLDRHRVKRVMDELRKEGLVRADGAKRGARWVLVEVPEQD